MATVKVSSANRTIDYGYVWKDSSSSWRPLNIAYVYTTAYGWQVVFPLKPGVPTNVVATPIYDPTNGSRISLSWSAPAYDGGGIGITDYAIYESTNNITFNFKTYNGSATTSRNISTGINACTTYYYKVLAINAAGEGDLSAASSGALAFTTPSAPTSVSASASSTTATISWSAPSNNGCSPITSYQVQRNTTGDTSGTVWVTANNSAGTNTHVFTGLTNGTTYYMRVRAINATYTDDNVNNDGTPSAFVTATPNLLPALNPSLSATRTAAGYTVTHSNYNSSWSYSGSISPTGYGTLSGSYASSSFNINIPPYYTGTRPTISANTSTRYLSCSWGSTWYATPLVTTTVSSSRTGYQPGLGNVQSYPNRTYSFDYMFQYSTTGSGGPWTDWNFSGTNISGTSVTVGPYSANISNTRWVRCRVTINTGPYTDIRFTSNVVTIP